MRKRTYTGSEHEQAHQRIARLLVSEVVRLFEAFLTVVDFIEFILKSSL